MAEPLRYLNIGRSSSWKSPQERDDQIYVCMLLMRALANRDDMASDSSIEETENESEPLKPVMDLDASEKRREDIAVSSVEDALILSLANRAKVDIGYISRISRKTPEKVIEALKGTIFQNPEKRQEDGPYVIIQREGRYRLDIGESQSGNLKRLDNFFASFDRITDGYIKELEKLYRTRDDLKEEATRKDDISDRIEKLKISLADINERLGMTNE